MTKQVRKFFSLWLAVSMIVNLLPMSVLAEEAVRSGLSASTSVPAEQESIGEAQILGEVVENRSEYTKEFILSNGLHMAVVYGAPVHYRENGQWEEIDNTLVSSGTAADGVYTNTAGAWEVSFPRQISPGGRDVEITKDGYTLSFALSGQLLASENDVFSTASAGGKDTFELQEVSSSQAQKKEPDLGRTRDIAEYPETVQEKLYSGLTYRNVFDNTHIIYDVISNLVKESIATGL